MLQEKCVEKKYVPSNGNLEKIKQITEELNNNHNCILIFDKNFVIKFANQDAANVFNLSIDNIINKNILDIINIKLG